MRRLTAVQVQRCRSAVYLAVSGGATALLDIHQDARRRCADLGDRTATDRALQWWRKRGTMSWSKEKGWVVVKPEGASAVCS